MQVAPIRRRAGLIGSLNAEWDHAAVLPARAPDGTPWSECHPDLRVTLGDVIDRLRGADPATSDPLLGALLQLHRDGDELAGRTILQAMLGATVQLLATGYYRRLADPEAAAVAATWEAIRTCPPRRRQRLAAGLKLDALQYLEAAQPPLIPLDYSDLDTLTLSHAEPRGGDPSRDVVGLLLWARDTGRLRQDQVALLASRYIDPPTSYDDLARGCGISPATVRKRVQRAVRDLAQAVQA